MAQWGKKKTIENEPQALLGVGYGQMWPEAGLGSPWHSQYDG